MSVARILVAEDPKVVPAVAQALAGYELLTPATVKEAEEMMRADGIDLFVLGIHFDDSRATELASVVRRSAGHERTPVVLIRSLPSTIAKFIRTSSNALKTSGTITDFLEFKNIEEMTAGLRKDIEAYLPGDKIISGDK